MADSTAFDSTNLKSPIVECPPGKKVVGGGGGTSSSIAFIQSSRPWTDESWIAVASENDPTDAGWDLAAWALCATMAE